MFLKIRLEPGLWISYSCSRRLVIRNMLSLKKENLGFRASRKLFSQKLIRIPNNNQATIIYVVGKSQSHDTCNKKSLYVILGSIS